MKTIHITNQEGVKLMLFPDNQPHIILDTSRISTGDHVTVVTPIRSSLELVNLMQVANALSHLGCLKDKLVIPYLMGARSDRNMVLGDSVDLEVVATAINSCGFQQVEIYDVHSPVALKLINRSINLDNSKLLQQYTKPNSVLICPDKGAAGRLDFYKKNLPITDVVICDKVRDLSTSKITLTVTNPELCQGRNCVIADDLCDAGGTFLAIASQIQPATLTLIVSHGLFSKGYKLLEEKFDEIITSDSFTSHHNSKKVTVVNLNL